MESELDVAKHVAALRRGLRTIAIAAAIGLVLGGFYGTSRPYGVQFEVNPLTRGAELTAAGVDPDDIDAQSVVESLLSELGDDDTEAAISDTVGADIELEALQGTGKTLVVTISATESETVEAAAAEVVEIARASYAQNLGKSIAGVRRSAEVRLDLALERLDEIDGILAESSNEQEFLIEGLLAQREARKSEIDTRQGQITGLDALAVGLADDMRALGLGEPKRSGGPVVLAIVGAVLASILAAGLIFVRSMLDRTIRNRRDLGRIGLPDLAIVLPEDPGPIDLSEAFSVIRHLRSRGEREAVIQLVAVDAAEGAQPLAGLVSDGSEGELVLSASVGDAAAFVADEPGEVVSLLVIPWGRVDGSSAVFVANRLAASGADRIGVLLCAVPRRELHRVES